MEIVGDCQVGSLRSLVLNEKSAQVQSPCQGCQCISFLQIIKGAVTTAHGEYVSIMVPKLIALVANEWGDYKKNIKSYEVLLAPFVGGPHRSSLMIIALTKKR